ncbi:NAD(P)-dependent alcohol dehydrogenase [Planomonospora venezuelensis]|uniref:NADPH:quinone reductase-like Zn-dependent oxidoreductase n=1 Tax=Planomonospora venezuelensis TaxID=1999 RepID=A0A841CY53_PLAVE|nr:NAD(P)-dependent alcohol dehydrogenase [Planomonospora venezuelensis]MBB5963322.1 NADPH:quinone reductase-like Zn-dependent oxidoreductase [Planomonospora venezuelensis]GIN02727.1 NADPH:quinone reductase [Planomonospora venezuelensis]
MKAIVQDEYGPPHTMSLGEVPIPVPGAGDVLIRVHAAGVDYGVWHVMTGLPLVGRLGLGLRRPRNRVPGMDAAGVVESVGANVTALRPGDEVYGAATGAYAQFALARPGRLARKPANLSFTEAAAVPVSGVTALRAVGRITAGEKVLVIGAGGGVGSFATQLAVAGGARVTAVCSTAKAGLVRSLGAQAVIDYTREPLTGTYDVIIDIAGIRPLALLRGLLAERGRLVIVGGEGGGRWFGGLGRMLAVRLITPFTRQRLDALIALTRTADLNVLRDLIEAGAVRPAVGRTYCLAEASTAVGDLAAGNAPGKLVITVD